METTLSKDVQEKLDMINWDSLKDKYGISRDTFYNNPHLVSQPVYGQMTDLVFASKEDFSGLLSLRADMDTSGEKPEMKVRAFTMEKPKTMADTLFLYRQPITSEKVKETLLERGEWIGPDGKKAYGTSMSTEADQSLSTLMARSNSSSYLSTNRQIESWVCQLTA